MTTAAGTSNRHSPEVPLGNHEQAGKEGTTSPIDFCGFVCCVILFPVRVLLGCIAFTCGFCFNSCSDARKMGEKQETWNDTKAALNEFLKESGISDELKQGWNMRFVKNARIVNAIERKIYPNGRAHATRIKGESNSNSQQVDLKKAHRIMKFATAAYGPQVIANAVFESKEHLPPNPTAKIRTAVMTHIGVPNKDENIGVMKLKYGEKVESLRHFCVIDHANKCIVLAVRGTYSVSSTFVDLAGYCEDFCGAQAHAGMAKMARGIWEASGSDVAKAVNDHQEYEFIICGHSLGAGVAGLLHVLIHHDELLPVQSVHTSCYLFGGPPTISTLYKDPEQQNHTLKAVQNCKSFIFRQDMVPFISVDSARRFIRILAAIDDLNIPFWKTPLLDHEFLEPTEEMLQAYRNATQEDLPSVDKAPQLYIPADSITWIESEQKSCSECSREEYRFSMCEPMRVVNFLHVSPGGIGDHLTGRYEHSLLHSQQ